MGTSREDVLRDRRARWEDNEADEKTVAVQWECSGTFNGEVPFAGLQPNGRKFTTTVMNFYSFDLDGKICKDVAATGIAGILQGIGAIPRPPCEIDILHRDSPSATPTKINGDLVWWAPE